MDQLHPAVKLASELIKISSENPTRLEKEIINFIADWLKKDNVPFELQEVSPGRNNLIARVKGEGKRPPITLIAHCDTVPVGEGWSVDPLGGIIQDGKLYGRGAADMKSGLAAALYAVKEANKAKSIPGDFVVVVSVDEEGPGMEGIRVLLDSNILDASSMVIAPEPTGLDIVRAHRGVMWYEITTYGKSSHGGHAERGIDANHALAEIICELKTAVQALPFDDPLLKQSLISVGKMNGGEKTNVVPNKARAEIDFRVVPPMNAEDANILVQKAVQRAVSRVPGAKAKVKNLGLQRPPVETPADAEVIQRLTKSYKAVMNKDPQHAGYVAYTDAAVVSLFLNNRNAICFGPGNLEQGHTIDEWAFIDEIEKCAEIFKHLACNH